LDLFTAIAEWKETARDLAQRCKAAERGVRILADYLTVQGFVTKEGNRYKLTLDSAVFLDRRSPRIWDRSWALLAPNFTEAFQNVTDAVRKGGTVSGEAGTVAPEHPLWIEFAKSMIPMMAKAAEEIAQFVKDTQPNVKKVLDIAAGHGLFGVEIAKRCAHAEIVALDWANVLPSRRILRIGRVSRTVIGHSPAMRFVRTSGRDTISCCSPIFSTISPRRCVRRFFARSITVLFRMGESSPWNLFRTRIVSRRPWWPSLV
jgi:hypothetical protein